MVCNGLATCVEQKINVFLASSKFHKKVQAANEPFEQFVMDLRLLVKGCAYANSDEMIRYRIVFGIYSPGMREKLLHVGSEQTLSKTLDIAWSHDISEAQLKTISGSANTQREDTVHAMLTGIT